MKKHIVAIFAIAVATLFISTAVYADSDATSYKISGYNKARIITDENGAVLDDYGFCLDHTETTPNHENSTFTRKKLSEITTYSKSYGNVTLTNTIKQRLLKIVINRTNLETYAKTINLDKLADYVVSSGHFEDFYRNSGSRSSLQEAAEALGYTIDSDTSLEDAYAIVRSDAEVMRKALQLSRNRKFSGEVAQRLIWLAMREDNIEEYINNMQMYEKDTVYYLNEKSMLGFHIPDSYSNENSLYNTFYVPLLEYVDAMDDYFAQGYDAWVYVADNIGVQNILGAFFQKSVEPEEDPKDPEEDPEDPGETNPKPEEVKKAEEVKNPNTSDGSAGYLTIAIMFASVITVAAKMLLRRR